MNDTSERRTTRIVRRRPNRDTDLSRRGEVSHVWRITYRNRAWDDHQGPVTKIVGDAETLDARLRKLRSPNTHRPAATILSVERAQVLGNWEEVDR